MIEVFLTYKKVIYSKSKKKAKKLKKNKKELNGIKTRFKDLHLEISQAKAKRQNKLVVAIEILILSPIFDLYYIVKA